jgi:UDP-N-acetyl-D-galactosamine dehydrogenase
MGKFIADKTINEILNIGKVIKDSNILILGFTFKEDCPDVRNTRVIDIIKIFKDSGANIDVYDPWIDLNHNDRNFTIIDDPLKSDKKYDAIVVAVSHKQFKKYTPDDYSKLSSDKKVIIDIKNIVKNPTWRL